MTESARRQADARRRWLRASLLLAMTAGSGVLAQGTAQPVVRVGFIANYEPFSFLGKDQRLTGFDVEVVRVLLESLGMTMQAEFGRFEQLRAKAQAGELDLVGNQLLLLPENRRWFDFVRPYANMQLVCVQHEDDERDFLSLDDFLGKRLGVLRHTGMEEQARGALGNGVVAFDRLGHGAVVCAGETITCAWKQAQSERGFSGTGRCRRRTNEEKTDEICNDSLRRKGNAPN